MVHQIIPSYNNCSFTAWTQQTAEPEWALQVIVYHGTKRAAADVEGLTEADVVLTTYSTLESEHRKVVQPGKVTCGYCNKQFYPERLRVHLK